MSATRTLALIFFLFLAPTKGHYLPPECNCQPCREIHDAPWEGTYFLEHEQGPDMCGNTSCLYEECDTHVLLCMCDPGDVIYTTCPNGNLTGSVTFTEGGVNYTQLLSYDTSNGLFKAEVPAHSNLSEAAFFMSTEWDWIVTCSNNWDTAARLPNPYNDWYFRSLMLDRFQSEDIKVYWIEYVTNATLDLDVDIAPNATIYQSYRVEVNQSEFEEASANVRDDPDPLGLIDCYRNGVNIHDLVFR